MAITPHNLIALSISRKETMNTQISEQTKRSLLLEPIKRLCTAEQFGAIGKLLDFEIKIAKSHWIAEVCREVETNREPVGLGSYNDALVTKSKTGLTMSHTTKNPDYDNQEQTEGQIKYFRDTQKKSYGSHTTTADKHDLVEKAVAEFYEVADIIIDSHDHKQILANLFRQRLNEYWDFGRLEALKDHHLE